jgi:hypothetical protein
MQTTLQYSGKSVKPHSEKRQQELLKLLVNWLIADSRPLIIVQSTFFC